MNECLPGQRGPSFTISKISQGFGGLMDIYRTGESKSLVIRITNMRTMKRSNTLIAAFSAAILAATIPQARSEDGIPPDSKEKQEENGGAAKPYKLKTCIVSDEKLGEMGEPVVFTYEGQEIKLCCKSCRKAFDKDPAKYLKKLPKTK